MAEPRRLEAHGEGTVSEPGRVVGAGVVVPTVEAGTGTCLRRGLGL